MTPVAPRESVVGDPRTPASGQPSDPYQADPRRGSLQGHASWSGNDAYTGHPREMTPITPFPTCPICQGSMLDRRQTKSHVRAPDFVCADEKCRGVVWPPKPSVTGS